LADYAVHIDVFDWDDEDDPAGNYQHIVGTGEVTAQEVEEIMRNHQGGPDAYSDTSGLPVIFGTTADGKRIAVVYEDESDAGLVIVRPKTSFPVTDYGG
jgi:hypothetical protein